MELIRKGYVVLPQYIDEAKCQFLLDAIKRHSRLHPPAEVKRTFRNRSLDYKVIDGLSIAEHLPELMELRDEIQSRVASLAHSQLMPITSARAAVNVNITSANGEYRWHYDRNEVTAILYLNEVQGGEIEMYPNYRILLLGGEKDWVQEKVDRILQQTWFRKLFGKLVTLKPERGMLLIMRGVRTLHSVRPVNDKQDRICLVFAFDPPGRIFQRNKSLDQYLYSSQSWEKKDPNYY
jgi:uncharacterized protein YlzI (FlbEa/FlbD family)